MSETSEDIARQSREILTDFCMVGGGGGVQTCPPPYKRLGNMIDFKTLFLAVSMDFR